MSYKTTSRKYILEQLNSNNMAPLRKLGQNFLTDEIVAKTIVDSLKYIPGKTICEIGPGFGALTDYLIKYPNPIKAVELDHKMAAYLREYFSTVSNVTIVEQDFLKTSITDCSYVIGNLPYYITTDIMKKLLNSHEHLTSAVLMIQKEVYPKVVAKPNDDGYGPLAIMTSFVGKPTFIMEVPPSCFYPEPPIVSFVFKLDFFPNVDHKFFTQMDHVVRSLFLNRRKTILNNLSMVIKSKEKALLILESLGVSPLKRPEQLDLEFYINLTKTLQNEHY